MLQEFKHQTHLLLNKYQNTSSSSSSPSSLSLQAAMFPSDQELSVSAFNPMLHSAIQDEQPQKMKKKRNLPGNPDPEAEVIALSPKTLMATNRFVCEICNKGFQRDQNLQLHRRGHNLPWKLKQRSNKENRKRVYVCPEPTCVHHHPSRALGDLTGIKKHFCRKHGEKKWKCEKCSKFYAVQSDWKAHSKTCGTREYRCDCGTLFSRKDSFITHRAFCDALAEESARLSANSILLMHPTSTASLTTGAPPNTAQMQPSFHLNPSSLFPNAAVQHHQPPQRHFANPPSPIMSGGHISLSSPWDAPPSQNPNHNHPLPMIKTESMSVPPYFQEAPPPLPPLMASGSAVLSATALLQKAASIGATVGHVNSSMAQLDRGTVGHVNMKMASQDYLGFGTWQKGDPLTRDFLGLTADHGSTTANGSGRDHDHHHHRLLSYAAAGGGVDELFPSSSTNNGMYNDGDNSLFKHHQLSFGFAAAETASETWGNC
ncbi:PREDICTED: protein indeterminate-domain 12-like [Ipomoea nil]|uniref:protein indeterminate-domain 12-like n=1 Tax=Ipomoea nil TaxID=35883 RepID=UPI0009015791|nr:PREDICTED: protein indeterminate-domain 12-like [Ipomoea nil]